jgi:hypothetical protein
MVCVFSRFSRKKAQVDTLKTMQKCVEIELRTFTNHLAQISSAYESLQQHDLTIMAILEELQLDNLKIIKLLEELNKKK